MVVRHIQVQESYSAAVEVDNLSESDADGLLGELRELSARLSGVLQRQQGDRFDGATDHDLVSNILRFRRQRNRLFGEDLFGEPAWDILLELYALGASGQKLSVSGACYASGVPLTTALRWVSRLERDGWIYREDDPCDKRRSWLKLCDDTEKRMAEFLKIMAAAFADIRH